MARIQEPQVVIWKSKTSTKTRRTLQDPRSLRTTHLPTRIIKTMEDTPCIPCHSSLTIQRKWHLWEQLYSSTSWPDWWTRGVQSGGHPIVMIFTSSLVLFPSHMFYLPSSLFHVDHFMLIDAAPWWLRSSTCSIVFISCTQLVGSTTTLSQPRSVQPVFTFTI